MRKIVALSLLGVLAACSSGKNFELGGPVASPAKPVYVADVHAPDVNLIDDFLRVAGTNAVFFDTDTANLRADARDTLDRQATWLINHREVELKIEGHADERATDGYNQALGERRANAVVDYLVDKGVSRVRFLTISYGEAKPLIRKKGDVELNRRAVTVLVD